MKKLLLVLIIACGVANAQYPNIRISKPFSNDPEEVTIAINPTNPLNLAAGANIDYYFFSLDGGEHWNQGNMSSSYGVWGDPCVIFDDVGNLYYAHLSNPPSGHWIDRIVVQKSTDGGQTWSNGVGVGYNGDKNQDKEWLVADMTDSPFRNNIYMSWTEFDRYGSHNPDDSSRILFSRSVDSGESWSKPIVISDYSGDCLDSDNTTEGAVPTIGPNGEIHISWAGPLGIMFDKSIDGGITFGRDIFVTSQPGGWDFNISGIYRCNGLPITVCDISDSPYRGTIYIVWSDQRNGEDDTDVFIVKSTDGGESWSEIKRINNDDSRRHQFLPWVAIDPFTGYIYVVFYDRRNTTGDATEVYLAKSIDGGETFENFKVSESPFTPSPSVFFGDYINIAALNGMVYPIWMRLDNGSLSVWTAIVADTTTSVAVHTGSIHKHLQLLQNYPNPFNGVTNIPFTLEKQTFIKIKIYNINGKLIKMLVNDVYLPGKYQVKWNGNDDRNLPVASGVYFYSLQTIKGEIIKKMILLQ